MRGLRALSLVSLKLFLREPAAFFFTLIFPLGLFLLFAAAFGDGSRPIEGSRFGAVDAMVPGLGSIIIATVGLIGIPITVATARERKVLRRLAATPLRPVTYIVADVAVNLTMTLAGLSLLIIAGLTWYGLRFGGQWPIVLGAVVFSAAAFFAVGYLIGPVVSTARTAQIVGQVLFFPMMFLSGATIPLDQMPASITRFSVLLPLTHVVDLLEGLWLGGPAGDHLPSVALLGGMLVVGTLLSARIFRWE